jgi:type I restriction enzyme S subunit
VRQQIANITRGVAQKKVSLTRFRQEIRIPAPCLSEQRRIVDILEDHLSRLDAAEAGCDRATKRVSALRVSLLTKALFTQSWTTMPLAEALALSVGGLWGAEPGVEEVQVRVLRVTELRSDGDLDPSTAATRSVSARQLVSRQLVAGDLLLEKSGGGPNTPVGRVGLVNELDGPSICSNFMQLMRPRGDVVPRFLHLYLNGFYLRGGTAPMQKASTNIRNIKASEYLKIPVPLPDRTTQEAVVVALEADLSASDRIVAELRRCRRRSARLRRALIEAAFSGRLTGHSRNMDLVEEMAGV